MSQDRRFFAGGKVYRREVSQGFSVDGAYLRGAETAGSRTPRETFEVAFRFVESRKADCGRGSGVRRLWRNVVRLAMRAEMK